MEVDKLKLQRPDYHPNIQYLAKAQDRCNLTIQVRNSKPDISNSSMEEDILQVTINNFWKKTKINRMQLMSQVIKAAYKSKRIWTCDQVPLRPELITKIIRAHIMEVRTRWVVAKRKFLAQRIIHILHTRDLGQLQNNSNRVIVMSGLSTREWWELIKCKLPCILQELVVDLTFKLIKIRDLVRVK